MKRQETIFVTGGTGYLGSYLIHLLTQQGHRVIALVRGKNGESKDARIHKAIASGLGEKRATEAMKNTILVEGDILEKNLGLSKSDEKKVASVAIVIHSAASILISEKLAASTRAINYDGTRNVMNLFKKLGTNPVIGYVSTRYLYGEQPDGVIITEMTEFGEPHNSYEKSKQDVHWMLREDFADCRIIEFRPSIIVSTQEETVKCFSNEGPFAFFKCLCEIRNYIRQKIEGSKEAEEEFRKSGIYFEGEILNLPMALPGQEKKGRVDYVPLNWVAESMISLLIDNQNEALEKMPNGSHAIFNLNNENPIPIEHIYGIPFFDCFGIKGIVADNQLVKKQITKKKESMSIGEFMTYKGSRPFIHHTPYLTENTTYLRGELERKGLQQHVPFKDLDLEFLKKMAMGWYNFCFGS